MIDNKMPWFACYQSKLLEALGGMKADVKLVYLIMILRIYDCAGPCPDTLDAIAMRAGLNKRRTSAALDTLFRAGKLTRETDGIMNPFAAEIIAESIAFRQGRARAGQKGASRRWKKHEQNQTSDYGTANGLPMANDSHLHLQLQLIDSVPSGEVVGASPKRRRAPRQSMREDWTLGEKDIAYARARQFSDERIELMARACRDYHLKHGTLIAGDVGLAATWRTWVENEIKFSKERANGYRGLRSLQDDSKSVSGAATRLQEQIRSGTVSFAPRPRLDVAAGENDQRLLPARRSP